MDGVKTGQRLLLALTSGVGSDDLVGDTADVQPSFAPIIIAAASGICFVALVAMCVCGDSAKKKTEDGSLRQVMEEKPGSKSTGTHQQDGREPMAAPTSENGGPPSNRNSATMSGHSRQASSGSAHNLRPTSLRELPEPPVSSHHARNASQSGVVEVPSSSGHMVVGEDEANDPVAYGYHHYHEPNHHRANSSGGGMGIGIENNVGLRDRPGSINDGYDHLGAKPSVKPTDYDSLAAPRRTQAETPTSEAGPATDGHYSLLRERTYAVVKDVKAKASKLYDPYSLVKDEDEDSSQTGSNYYAQEDPYNHIGESDGAVSAALIRRIQQSGDADDPYATLGDEEGGDGKSGGSELQGAVGGAASHAVSPSTAATVTPLSQFSAHDSYSEVSDEYAVVQKSSRGTPSFVQEQENGTEDSLDIAPYSVGPPEPPRRYHLYEEEEGHFAESSAHPPKEHKYSKVTARESLASISARTALNPYEFVPDLPENTYATVEGGSGDGIVREVTLRGTGGAAAAAAASTETNRLSQNSDTYAEIAISGGGLSTSITSTGSSAGGGGGGGSNSLGSSSGAPVPPSLDSLHMMTKSQTSSEGDRLSDRLSDRHLASPEDSALGIFPWADELGTGSADSSEDGYSTLRRTEPYSASDTTLRGTAADSRVRDAESGEITLVPNYQKVKDCISDNEINEECENDPNYESVDEARSKVAALKASKEAAVVSSSHSKPTASPIHLVQFPPVENGVLTSMTPTLGHPSNGEFSISSTSTTSHGRQKRMDHDYEEVDLSPPTSPSQPGGPTPGLTPHLSPSTTPTGATSATSFVNSDPQASPQSVSEAKERLTHNHLYEELADVRLKKQGMTKINYEKSGKNVEERKKGSASNDKKKGEEKKKGGSEEKRKSGSEEKRKSGGGGDEKRKSGAAQPKNTRL
ncbi:uncharacterized protein LOC101860366 [Aplysia californica]|uniref:Uncharacterized protein LOC101860366 n=1 Tax=Aplysia californica TaxID=6500 RepID=A0ABM0K5B2_APLCA|nr:uncharacterized protein LOC101860366 [Aplysia californica]